MTPSPTGTDADRRSAGDSSVVGGVVLAAGEGSRFEGGNKLTATVDGTPIVRLAVEPLIESDLDDVVVVVGHEPEVVKRALDPLDISYRSNERYEAGQSTSVEVGLDAARERQWDATLFALGDMPFVQSSTVDAVLSAYLDGRGTLVAPTYKGKRGNPALFDATHYDTLTSIDGDQGGRRLLEEHDDTAFVETSDPGVTRDVDTETDLEKFTEG